MPELKWVLLLAALPALAQNQVLPATPYAPPTASERAKWFLHSTYGPGSLFASGPITSALRTWRNRPEEWGPGWEGFGKRYGTRLLNNSVMNGVEASLGAAWGEDPRYHRAPEGSTVKQRIGSAVKQVFLNRYADGRYRPGIACAAGITAGSFAQNAWMPESVNSGSDAGIRIGNAYFGRIIGNMFREFAPSMLRIGRRKNKN